MTLNIRKPILVGGLGVCAVLWLWNSLHDSLAVVGETALLGAIALGVGFWIFKSESGNKQEILPTAIDKTTAEKEIAKTQTIFNYLEAEAGENDISDLKQALSQLSTALDREELKIAIVGTPKVGKTTLQQILTAQEIEPNLTFSDTPALLSQTEANDSAAIKTAFNSDLVLFTIVGDITQSEWQSLQQLKQYNQKVLLIFNKLDLYQPEEQSLLIKTIQDRVAEIISPTDVIAISAAPKELKIKEHQKDGSIDERMEQRDSEIKNLQNRLVKIVRQERQKLVFTTTWREAIFLKQDIKERLNQIRRDRALPITEKYQWLAAATAFANPLPAVDLVATAAINAQMLVDLSEVYQEKFSLSQAQTAMGTIGELMVKLGLVELSTQAIGSVLKSNAFTYVAGGAVQGISAAYLTRIAGLSLIEYFQDREIGINQEGFNLELLGEKIKKVFKENQRKTFLQNFVRQTIDYVIPDFPNLAKTSS
jgi:hypothetical protein